MLPIHQRNFELLRDEAELGFPRKKGALEQCESELSVRDTSGEPTNLRDAKLHSFFSSEDIKVLLLDYDGTLRPFEDDPAKAVPDAELLKLLQSLNERKDLKVVIISGRSAPFLEETMGRFKQFTFVAEHGFQIRRAQESYWDAQELTPVHQSVAWRRNVMNFVEKNDLDRIQGSFLEEKSKSLVWHYRGADEIKGVKGAVKLVQDLQNASFPRQQITHGNKMVEIFGPQRTSKGMAMNNLLDAFKAEHASLRTVLCAGDDVTDESMFQVCRTDMDILSVKIGEGRTDARFRAASPEEFKEFLMQI